MKKVLLIMFIVSSLLFASKVPNNIDQSIRNWVKKTYSIDQWGSSTQKMMYKEEIKNYIWLQENATDKVTLKRVTKIYPPSQWGYTLLKMMYKEEMKNNNW